MKGAQGVAKDKKKSKKKDKKSGSAGTSAAASLKALSQNPLVADVVAAALVRPPPLSRTRTRRDGWPKTRVTRSRPCRSRVPTAGAPCGRLALDVGRSALEAFNEYAAKKPKRTTVRTKPD